MGRTITRDEINEVRKLGITLDTIAKYKGVSVLRDVIDEAVDKELSIICIGRLATGKSTALKVILGTIPGNPENVTLDEVISEPCIKLLKNGDVKYCTMHANNVSEAYNRLTDNAHSSIVNTLLIELTMDINGSRAINSVSEIITTNNGKDTALIPIVDVHKERFRKINELV